MLPLKLKRKLGFQHAKPLSPASINRENGGPNLLKALITKAYGYSEITRLREKIVSELHENKKKTLMVTSPTDNTGNTFLVSVLGYSAAYFGGIQVLLVDLNMRRPELHLPFGLEQEHGFCDILIDSVPWTNVIKPSGLVELDIITAGRPDADLSFFLNRPVLNEIVPQMKEKYDLVVFDTSPVLVRNRNNFDPIHLSTICDMVIVVAQAKMTSKNDLKQTVSAIQEGGGQVRGIVYNKQFHQGIISTLTSR
jgi:Mrp family chromosome partitioning ATPase